MSLTLLNLAVSVYPKGSEFVSTRGADMLERIKLSILLQGLTLLVLLGPACEASSLGLTVHVLPLDSDGGNTVGLAMVSTSPNSLGTVRYL